MNPSFIVSAEYFYALTAHMPPQIDADQRYRLTCLQYERQNVRALLDAITARVVSANAALTPEQAARRLRALGSGLLNNLTPEHQVQVASPIANLVTGWLGHPDADISLFWSDALAAHAPAHLELVLIALTRNHPPLITALQNLHLHGINDVEDLAAMSIAPPGQPNWTEQFFPPPPLPDPLPPFTAPGTREDRFSAFVRHLRNFFSLPPVGVPAPAPQPGDGVPLLDRAIFDPLQAFLDAYNATFGALPSVFGAGLDPDEVQVAATEVFPHDDVARAWLEQAVRTLDHLYDLADVGGVTPEVRFSIVEGLYARGFIDQEKVAALPLPDFQDALTGTVAYNHAGGIHARAHGVRPGVPPPSRGFRPINPDGLLANCIPPLHLSPLGPTAYLQEMLKITEASTCEEPFPDNGLDSLDDLIAARRGPLGDLRVTAANLSTPLPAIDLVNECLEALAANAPDPSPQGVVYDTSGNQLDGHKLHPVGKPAVTGGTAEFLHDPVTLFEVLPEHSTPATPVKLTDGYDRLKVDFSAPALPYSQPLDINRSYLRHLGTSRFEVMRTFREEITEFVLNPAAEPVGFQQHLWRYPVRIDIAREYLEISAEEYDRLYTRDLAAPAAPGAPRVRELYGFPSQNINGTAWTQIIVRVSEFLKRTGLSYCEFLELWRSEFVRFHLEGSEAGFPDCQPCYLDGLTIDFDQPRAVNQALKQLAVFIRLWRKLQHLRGAKYSFADLRDICDVLHLFRNGVINPDFIRQLVAFQMLRDCFALTLTDPDDGLPGVGADRTHLLALWIGPTARKWDWAVDNLLDGIQYYGKIRHKCGERPQELVKLLGTNLKPLSRLGGFDPDIETDTWHALPTHTLRFAELLAKIFASKFGVGEVLFLFTSDAHLRGDDPFPLQSDNEALDSQLGLPDDEKQFSLWELRRKLRDVKVFEEELNQWTWTTIDTTLREEFGYTVPAGQPDRLLSLGEHFFPDVLEVCCCKVDPLSRQYGVPLALAQTAPLMWNTPPEVPFRHDTATEQLRTQLPLTDEAVIAKLGRIRQLNQAEQRAVQDLYFQPRIDLATFAFIFTNFGEAEERLIQEPDETKRWAYFRREFAYCYSRCRVIAEHLACHVTKITGRSSDEDYGLAWCLLKYLFADENNAASVPLPVRWENDNGQVPPVTWGPGPNAGAFAALLGLMGTGLLGEFMPQDEAHNLNWVDDTLVWNDDALIWREVRGPTDAFGNEENAWNAAVATVLPTMDLQVSHDLQRFVTIRNGFALSNSNGVPLGGAQGFAVRWRGMLLIEQDGEYLFRGGAPTEDRAEPDFDPAWHHRWRVKLERGQRRWTLLSHRWPDTEAPAACTAPLVLGCGTYQLTIEFIQPQPLFSRPEKLCLQTTGFQLKYSGPDSGERLVAIPTNKLFRDSKDDTLARSIQFASVGAGARSFLNLRYTSTLRDIRRTYQRAFKAFLFAHNFSLSAKPIADDGQSEIGYMLAHPAKFAGKAYFRGGPAFLTHLAAFDFNLLPIFDNFFSPDPGRDQRVHPSNKRKQALFDWWERVFDYATLRRETGMAREHPVWLLFHEAAERHPDDPAQLVHHMGVDLRHSRQRPLGAGRDRAGLVLLYHQDYEVTSDDLEDEPWAVRVWRAETWTRALIIHFAAKDIEAARTDLWASDEPSIVEAGEPEAGNTNLAQFIRDGGFENGEPRRYLDVKRLNDCLRERGRGALLAYLCGMNRVKLPWRGYAEEPKHLSELLLLDVEVGLCRRTSRIEEAISAAQTFIQRVWLGLEASFVASPAFVLLWDRRFVTFHVWEACKRRDIYRENWIDWDDLQEARRGEAFRFLDRELRRAALTMPVPGGLENWPDQLPPDHPGLMLLQSREPSEIRGLVRPRQGLDLLGTPERHARPSWLTAVRQSDDLIRTGPHLPFWIQAAIRLGTRFLRIAAAGIPPASSAFEPHRPDSHVGCCIECGRPHSPVVDEYYFWLIDSRHFTERAQDAEWGATEENESAWHQPDQLPGLLYWPSQPMVHLAWSRLHNGEFQPPRRSDAGVRLPAGVTPDSATPRLEFLGRQADSLSFEVVIGPPNPGFRFDIATDTAVVLPEVAEAAAPGQFPDGLPAYPFFVYFDAGAPLMPASLFGPAIAVAGWLRTHCRFEAALKWYGLVYNPLDEDLTWCPREHPGHGGLGRIEEVCCSSIVTAQSARDRSIALHYLETLLQWGDAVMRRNSAGAFEQARVIFDTAARMLGLHPKTVHDVEADAAPPTIVNFVPRRAQLNPRLLSIHERVSDRLAVINSCLNARRLQDGGANRDILYRGNPPLRDGWLTTVEVCPDEQEWCCPHSCYRFTFLIRAAQELAGEVRTLGAALLTAYDKGDAEYLASLRATHERQLLNIGLEIRQNQWREADWQVQALRKTKEMASANRRYYQILIDTELIGGEIAYQTLTTTALGLQLASQLSEGIGQGVSGVPDLYTGAVGPCPVFITHLPVGSKLGGIFAAGARISNSLANSAATQAALSLTESGWTRREDEWRHQVEILDIEIEQIERQILAAERRRGVSLRELDNHGRQMEHAGEMHDFLRDKFTSHALYLWLQQETAALHQQMYELAEHTARQAQRAFNYERGYTTRKFLPAETWDTLHEGLQAGERLQFALRQMEKAYFDENCREYELTKHISLRLHFPMQFLCLKITGTCDIEIPEWMFDLDYPGHYLRRIKNVTVTIPCIVGPYTGVHCRLTLLGSTTRVDPRLREPAAICCVEGKSTDGYETVPDDLRVIRQYAAKEAIATSSGQNDSGLFELNFRDERYLPFEFAGAISRWRIELPPENNMFDLDTLSDFVLHLNYTTREGGDVLRRLASEAAQRHLPGDGWQLFDVEHEFPDQWSLLSTAERCPRLFQLRIGRRMFPFLPANQGLLINHLGLLFEVSDSDNSASHTITFTPSHRLATQDNCDCKGKSMDCFASAEWPGLYHGVCVQNRPDFLGPLSKMGQEDLGNFCFPSDVGRISRIFLLCGYEIIQIRHPSRNGNSANTLAMPGWRLLADRASPSG